VLLLLLLLLLLLCIDLNAAAEKSLEHVLCRYRHCYSC
jgi:hypothetical protein